MLVFWIVTHHSGWPLSMPKLCCCQASPVSKIGSVSVEHMELIRAWHLGKSYIWHLSSRKPSTCLLALQTPQILSLFSKAEKFHFLPLDRRGWLRSLWRFISSMLDCNSQRSLKYWFYACHVKDWAVVVLLCILLLEIFKQDSSATNIADAS